MLLKFSDLFDGLGTEGLRYSELCKAWSGREIELAGYLTRAHVEAGQVLLVNEPGACPDCSPAPVACLALPGFSFTSAETPVRLRGRLAYGFALDAQGNGSFLRLEGARISAGLPA